MVCHGELARLKPDPRHLTLFYLVVAAGGVLGGLFVALAAPYLFLGYWEYEISLWLAALLFLVVLFRDRRSWLYSTRVKSPLVLLGAAALLPESMALAIGSTQLAGTLPSIVIIVGALFLLQSQTKRRNPKPARGARASASAPAPAQTPLQKGNRLLLASCAIVLLILGATLTTLAKASLGQIASVRDFYGALTIDRQNSGDPERDAYALKHGEIVHGFEFRAPGKQLIPTSYFSEDSGLGLLLAPHLHAADPPVSNDNGALHIGDVGLGIGTVAAYARAGDSVRFYEINPQVVRLASDPRYFEFLHDSPAAPVDVVLGDGRLSLERELAQGASQDYDVLIVDAFNGDAVPVHLLTIEAFELYLQRLKNPGGVLAVNVTNTFLDLRPVVVAAAERLGLASVWVHCDGDSRVSYTNDWVLLSRDAQRIDAVISSANGAAKGSAKHAAKLEVPQSRLWTDDYSNLFQALADKSRSSSVEAGAVNP